LADSVRKGKHTCLGYMTKLRRLCTSGLSLALAVP
jgi:hypothetical protein